MSCASDPTNPNCATHACSNFHRIFSNYSRTLGYMTGTGLVECRGSSMVNVYCSVQLHFDIFVFIFREYNSFEDFSRIHFPYQTSNYQLSSYLTLKILLLSYRKNRAVSYIAQIFHYICLWTSLCLYGVSASLKPKWARINPSRP